MPDGSPGAITARGLKKRYGQREVVSDVAIDVRRGEVVGLLGPNGAGKTTSFYMIMGLVRPDGGRVSLGEHDVTRWAMHRRARAGMGYLSQGKSIFQRLSVEDNLRAILQLTDLPASRRRERCEQLLREFDLTSRRHTLGRSLSGGETRRTEIARTLATDPYFILLDEPFTGIDPIVRQDIQDIVLRLREQGIGILITDHNEGATLDIIDRGYILFDGKVMTQGTSRELLADPVAREVYFGEKIGREQPR